MKRPFPELETLLSGIAPVPVVEWRKFAASIEEMSFPKGALVFQQGDAEEHVHFIKEGLVRLSYLTFEGREFTKSFIREGQLFASLQAMEGKERSSFSVVALERVVLQRFPYRAFRERFSRHACWSLIAAEMFLQIAIQKEEREHELLALSPRQRYERFVTTQGILLARLSQVEIARWVGITPVALSRIRRRRAGR